MAKDYLIAVYIYINIYFKYFNIERKVKKWLTLTFFDQSRSW